MSARRIAVAQGLLYLVTGLWPLVSLRTFERVTGPKADDWLVRTVGLIATAIGLVLLVRAGPSGRGPDPLLGVASAAAFATTDVVHVARRVISPVYLLDAGAELLIAAAWLRTRRTATAMPAQRADPTPGMRLR